MYAHIHKYIDILIEWYMRYDDSCFDDIYVYSQQNDTYNTMDLPGWGWRPLIEWLQSHQCHTQNTDKTEMPRWQLAYISYIFIVV